MRRLALLALLLALTGCGSAGDEGATTVARPLDELVAALQDGGQVIFLRHTLTDMSVIDQIGRPGICHRERPLTDAGREQARMIGRSFRALGIRVGDVLASRYCRTRETAVLAFGRARTVEPLTGLPPTAPGLKGRLEQVRRLLATSPRPGTVTVLVGHFSTIEDISGFELAEGELAVYEPLGGKRFRLLGRIPPFVWPQLVEAKVR